MGEYAKQFEELRIWQEARLLAKTVYADFGSGPAARDFGFRDQIQRACLSIMNNIAEGFERFSSSEFAHYLNIAKASCGEVRSMLYLAEDLTYLSEEVARSRRESALQLSKSIESLAKSIRSR
jgi:four helix bundle protein